jgi:putative ABC transport system permease protein
MAWWSRLANVFRSGAVERDLEAELQFHLEERIRERMAEGLTREAAAAEARRRFGSPLRWREQSRDVKLMPWIDSVGRDIRLGVRMLRKHAVVTAAAVVSLAMALGACVAAFSLVDALILRPLPVARPDRLVYLAFPTYSAERPEADTFNDPTFRRLRDASREQVDLFAMSTQVIRPVRFADGGGEKEPVRTQYVSGDAFDRLGIGPAAGRLISSEDDADPGTHPVAVVSHGFWTRRFAADPSIVGRWFTLEERAFQIVGIAEPGFTGIEPGRPTDLWMPYAMYNPRAFGNPQFNWFRVIGRLRENVPVEQAQAIAQTAFRNGRREQAPGIFGPSHSPANVERFLATPLYLRSAANGPSPLRREFERSLWILVSIAALVLLIAGSNVANLFLARTVAREREMALRLSIGADRRRLIQQLLIESAIVAGVASLLGLVFAAAAGPTVVGMLAPPEDPVRLDLRLNWRLIAVAGSLTVLTTALFGLAPALRASGVAPIAALKAGVRSGTRARVMRPFVAMQVAFGLVVLFVGGLLVLSFARLSSVNPGYATEDVLLLSLDQVRRVDEKEQRTALLQVLDRLRNVPRVQAVSSAEYNVVGRAWTHNIRMPGTQYDTIEVTMAPVTPGFFETMKIPVIAGRGLVEGDIESDTSTAVVVNESFATRYFGREPAVGRTLDARFALADGKHEVVGVVADTRYDLRKPAAPTVFIPLRLRSTGTVHVRVAGDAMALAARLREEVRAATPLFRVSSIRPQSAVVDQTLLRERLLALLSGFFAGVGLLIAAVGLYGVLSYSVVDRTREIGIRVALGARQLGVVRTVVADAGAAVLAGTACGLAGGLYLARFVETLLFEVRPLDFWSLALPLGTLLLAASVAAVLPALRAARVDPVIALRYE